MVQILVGVCNGLDAIHKKGYLHNDLKCDNIVLSDCIPYSEDTPSVWPIIIDFGKARPIQSLKRYKLTVVEQEEHIKIYTHLAPELIRGSCPQSVLTDVYSLGCIIKKVSTITSSQQLKSIGNLCTKVNVANRPSVTYVHDSLSNLATCKMNKVY